MKEQSTKGKFKGLWFLLAAVLVVSLLAAGGLLAWRLAGTASAARSPAVHSSTPAEFESRYGIQVVMLGVTAEGGLIDMRFRVTNAQKAALLLDPASRPRLVAEGSGAVLTMHVRPEVDRYEAGRVYYLLYANARNAIVPGSLVTVELGDLRLEHLVAQ